MSYVKNVWSDGDVITANKMNNIENGIATLQTDMGNITAEPMISITWAELKAKRDDGNLTPGMQYRITDYVCTTTQEETRAVSHPYDIIVTADDVNKLNESARACLHEGDNYYSAEGYSANLKAWEVKYCLDNDANRFAWADETNGKGVVYYLMDEKGNECPYDFKQIQFKRYSITECEKVPSLVGKLTSIELEDTLFITEMDVNNPVWCYTFCYLVPFGIQDATVVDLGDDAEWNVVENKIAPAYNYNDEQIDQLILNQIVFCIQNLGAHDNTFGNNCTNNTFGDGCSNNTFGNNCTNNTFGGSCINNNFAYGCGAAIFGDYCGFNTFDKNCNDNAVGNNCGGNTYGPGCSRNVLDDYCYSIVLDGCSYIKGVHDETNNKTTHNIHVLKSVHGSDDTNLYELPTKTNADNSVTYVGVDSNGDIITWILAEVNNGGSGGSATPMESITWSELKVKRDGGTLTPGM